MTKLCDHCLNLKWYDIKGVAKQNGWLLHGNEADIQTTANDTKTKKKRIGFACSELGW